ncbi:pyridoxal phosphate-dependent transferase [Suillus plorans]|uniref:Pyridoxal phosphate-dependent transferase n=1 Tax=Suillus plorans TaxID=116603 RepID=A0A9P7AKE0_9AGAM|nr:pyridoxal phosphate-dependent transferase [Suillus plorans]KAG1791250.1 pyridoxal phosphate-dependent transferase [Suillus plorans]
MASLDIDEVRACFPSLESGYIYADNAGGSQTAQGVIDRIVDYLTNTNVQLGADYFVSVLSTKRVDEGPFAIAELLNAASIDEIVFGPSSTMMLENIARALENDVQPGDEFIITYEHEANNGPWKRLAERRNAVVKYWQPTPVSAENPYSVAYKVEELLQLVSSRTRLAAITACSNILGSLVPVEEAVKALRQCAKEQGARKVEVCVDCVAHAPHRKMDVRQWDVDYCVFSLYKVYGAHNAAVYVRPAAMQTSLTSLAHNFLKVDDKPYKLQPGGPGYELVYGATAIVPYLKSLTPEDDLVASFNAIADHEQNLLAPLLRFLTDARQVDRGVRIVGTSEINLSRVPTVSFVVVGQNAIKSKDIVEAFDKKGGIGIRYGDFYAYSLIDNLRPKLDVNDGVVRISLVHYNTVEEVEKIVDVLREVLA